MYFLLIYQLKIYFIKSKAKNAQLEHLHEVACQRLEEIKITKRSLVELKKSKRPKRSKVEVTMEEDTEETSTLVQPAELVAEEN